MKAIILAGGFATRLRPLSCSKPKLLFPVVGTPLIDLMVAWLREGGVEEVILAVNHLSDRLRIEVGQRRMGSKVIVSVEEEPLGTAGPLRLVKETLKKDEPFIVVNGDIVSDIDLREMVRFHLEKDASTTVSLASVPDPTPYGSVTLDPQGRATKFEEKTLRGGKSALINAGAYVVDPAVLDLIGDDGPVSMEHAIFPVLAKERRMWGWKHAGYWYDIGRISEYLRANRELLAMKQNSDLPDKTISDAAVRQPSHFGYGTSLGKGVQVGPSTILCSNVSVKRGSVVRNSIIFEETTINEDCRVKGAIIGEKVVLGRRTTVGEGSVIAGEVAVAPNSVLRKNSVILT